MNPVKKSNPRGKISLDEVEKFENELGFQIPADYRDYLVLHNGGKFVDGFFRFADERDPYLEITTMFSLRSDDGFDDLSENWSLIDHWDLEEFEKALKPFFCFGEANGIILCFDREKGTVYGFNRDYEDEIDDNLTPPAFTKIADSFSEFVRSLKPEDFFTSQTEGA